MNKKEILEIRKQYTHERCSIDRICSCYVDGEKNIKTTMREAFLSLPEEETFKYFKIFKQTLSGTIGKNLLNLEFPLDAENPGGPQDCNTVPLWNGVVGERKKEAGGAGRLMDCPFVNCRKNSLTIWEAREEAVKNDVLHLIGVYTKTIMKVGATSNLKYVLRKRND